MHTCVHTHAHIGRRPTNDILWPGGHFTESYSLAKLGPKYSEAKPCPVGGPVISTPYRAQN